MSSTLGEDMHRLVTAYPTDSERDRAVRSDFLTFFADAEGPVRRDAGASHATASAFVFDPTLDRTLLVFHRKGRFWVQPGGHLEDDDASIRDAALRELREETGLHPAGIEDADAYDLDHHALSTAFGRCRSHLDVGIAMIASDEAAVTVSDESEDVRWWPVAGLPRDVPAGFTERLQRLRERL
ncbi:NUDIX hydrolase [Microbacterium sp. 3J1]|uniref:NUDIX hydrolase n=1 Tax=Microbacterium sp. 3J1 TaxID=861269 RepID=UPI000B0EDB10|nr:NUDIX domain-containing protein [Microbacterium sp. 3J1]